MALLLSNTHSNTNHNLNYKFKKKKYKCHYQHSLDSINYFSIIIKY